MRRFIFTITLSVLGGILAIPLPVHAQRIRSMGMINQAAASQAMIRQMTAAQMATPHIMSGGSGPIRWPRPGHVPFGFNVPYSTHTSSSSTMSSDIVSGGPGPHRWPYPGHVPFGFNVPYSTTATGGSRMSSVYGAYLSGLSPTFSPYASFSMQAAASVQK